VQKMKEMGAKGRRMGLWIHTLSSAPVCPPLQAGAQVLLIGRHWTAKWWCSGAETESPRILYARCPVGSGNMVMIASGPVIPAEQ
jgi:hypothetical protein